MVILICPGFRSSPKSKREKNRIIYFSPSSSQHLQLSYQNVHGKEMFDWKRDSFLAPSSSQHPQLSHQNVQPFKCPRQRDIGLKQKHQNSWKENKLKHDDIIPGQVVSTDQFVSALCSHQKDTRGKEKDCEKYCGGMSFVDQNTGFKYVQNQVSLTAAEMIWSKHLFDREASLCGITIASYCVNGVYQMHKFQRGMLLGQLIEFTSVGAHNQNGSLTATEMIWSKHSVASMCGVTIVYIEEAMESTKCTNFREICYVKGNQLSSLVWKLHDQNGSLTAAEMIWSKHSFEREVFMYGVTIASYWGGNGVYQMHEFQRDLVLNWQSIEFSSVELTIRMGLQKEPFKKLLRVQGSCWYTL